MKYLLNTVILYEGYLENMDNMDTDNADTDNADTDT